MPSLQSLLDIAKCVNILLEQTVNEKLTYHSNKVTKYDTDTDREFSASPGGTTGHL